MNKLDELDITGKTQNERLSQFIHKLATMTAERKIPWTEDPLCNGSYRGISWLHDASYLHIHIFQTKWIEISPGSEFSADHAFVCLMTADTEVMQLATVVKTYLREKSLKKLRREKDRVNEWIDEFLTSTPDTPEG